MADSSALIGQTVSHSISSRKSVAASGDQLALPTCDMPTIFNDSVVPGVSTVRSVDLQTMNVKAVSHSDKLIAPRLSPDGRYLAATTLTGDKLLLFNLSNQRWTDLVVAPAVPPRGPVIANSCISTMDSAPTLSYLECGFPIAGSSL